MSIALNLLSVGAAYGLITLTFQDGHDLARQSRNVRGQTVARRAGLS